MREKFIRDCAAALQKATTAAKASSAIYKLCCAYAKACGMDPDYEVSRERIGKGVYWVKFESGPHEWGIEVSMDGYSPVLAEPYWGFDLKFYDDA